MFDQKIIEKLQSYVYALIDPRSGLPFYIGKGNGNRVFEHVVDALTGNGTTEKAPMIREIRQAGREVRHIIVCHGMDDEAAYQVESALIEMCRMVGISLTNLVSGHGADIGSLTSDEVIRLYGSELLTSIEENTVIININKTYRRGGDAKALYEATRASWVIGRDRRKSLKIALAEYRGMVAEVFEIDDWYSVPIKGKPDKPRWAFNGRVAHDEIRQCYIHRAIQKKSGTRNPIRYCL